MFTELDQRRAYFKSRNRKQFIKQPLQEEERWLKALEAYIEKEEVPIRLEDRRLASVAIQSYLALQLFDEAAQLSILHREDEYVQKALKELNTYPVD